MHIFSASADIIPEPSSFDFGERTEIDRPALTATLRNDGDRTVRVTDVVSTCVCANLELSTTNLPPGDQPRDRHHWAANLYPEGAETPADD